MSILFGSKTVTQLVSKFTLDLEDLEEAVKAESKIITNIENDISALQQKFDSQKQYLEKTRSDAVNELSKGLTVINGIKAMLSGASQKVEDVIEDIAESIDEAFDDLEELVEDIIDEVKEVFDGSSESSTTR